MALLTEHDVLHKKFQASRFRQEGYNQDEVDDFLDEVADTIRVLTQENESLKNGASVATGGDEQLRAEVERLQNENAALGQQLQAAQQQAPAPAGEDNAQLDALHSRIAELEGLLAQANADAEAARADAHSAREALAAAPAAVPAGDSSHEAATGMLALAERLHDEYVRNGKDEGDRIIAEATSEGERIVREAEEQHARTLAVLEEEKGKLEENIHGLRTFESDYRDRLTEYLQRLLNDVANSSQS